MDSKSLLQAFLLLASVITACFGQFLLRIRPPAEGVRISVFYLIASLACYTASFGITASVLPEVNRKLAILILSLQYPMLYVMFTIRDGVLLRTNSVLAIALGYAIVAAGMFGSK
jgi:inner membrane protein involved in colicin E2 resistance